MIPQYELEALAEVLYPTLKAYLESPEGKATFEKWREQRTENVQQKTCNSTI